MEPWPDGASSDPRRTVHLDAAAGRPLSEAARAALVAALDDGWADPDRLYASARRARLLLDGAREVVAAGVGARPEEVSFVPGATLAASLAVLGVAGGRRRTGRHVVHSAVERSAVLHAVGHLGTEATCVGVDRLGRVDAAAYGAALRADTALACLIAASHEVGTRQPVAAVAAACRERGVPLLLDAASVVGREPVPAGWSALVADAAGWGGPADVGVLALRTGTRWRSALPGDERVPASPSLPLVLAAAVGLQAAVADADAQDRRLRALVDRVRERVAATVPDVEVVGDPVDRLAHLVTFSALYVDGEALVTALDRLGFAVGSGSSCTASSLQPSHVLVAMGVLTHGNVRLSLWPGTTEDDVERFLAVLPGVVADLRRQAGVEGL